MLMYFQKLNWFHAFTLHRIDWCKKYITKHFFLSIQGGGRKGASESSEGPARGGWWRQHGAFGGLIPQCRGGNLRRPHSL